MIEQSEMVNQQTDDQGPLADESKTSDQIYEIGNSYHNRSMVASAIHYNINKLVPTKYY